GVQSFITSQFDQPLQSIFSGNIIDLCPVGALTSRVWRFESRPWDMTHTATICSKCSVGCSVTQWQRRGQLVRVTSHENDESHGRSAIPAPPGTTMRIKERDDARVIVIVASDIETDVPIIDLRVKKAVSKRSAKLIVVYPDGVDLDRNPQTVHIRNQKGAAAAEVRKLASHERLENPGGPVAILFGDGHRREDINDLAKACGDLAEKVGGKE